MTTVKTPKGEGVALDGSTRAQEENRQTIIRLVIVTLFLFWVTYRATVDLSINYPLFLGLILTFYSVNAVLFIDRLYTPRRESRLYFSIFFDCVMIAWGIWFSGPATSPLFFVYYIIIVANTVRFGKDYLLVTSAGALVSYAGMLIIYFLQGLPLGPLSTPMEVGKIATIIFLTIYLMRIYTRELPLLAGKMALEEAVNTRTAHLAQETEKARKAERLRSQFLSTMSHELRTPLHSVIGFSDILLRSSDGRSENELKMLKMVGQNAADLLKRVEDITDLSRIMTGEAPPVKGLVNVREVVDSVVERTGGVAQKHDVKLVVVIDPGISVLLLDGEALNRILTELLDNAVKFSPSSGEVAVDITYRQRSLHISVIDRGEGMTAEEQEIIFDLFSQADGALNRRFGGMGLGLCVARALSESNGGSLKVVSKKGSGSTFIVSLPATPIGEEKSASQ